MLSSRKFSQSSSYISTYLILVCHIHWKDWHHSSRTSLSSLLVILAYCHIFTCSNPSVIVCNFKGGRSSFQRLSPSLWTKYQIPDWSTELHHHHHYHPSSFWQRQGLPIWKKLLIETHFPPSGFTFLCHFKQMRPIMLHLLSVEEQQCNVVNTGPKKSW